MYIIKGLSTRYIGGILLGEEVVEEVDEEKKEIQKSAAAQEHGRPVRSTDVHTDMHR